MPKKSKQSKKRATRIPQKPITCDTGTCFCKIALAILIIVLVWVSAATWSKIIITVAAIFIILAKHCPCHNRK